MIDDPLFYLVAVPALLIVGISKGGFGGGLGMMGVPMMALVMPPFQAAAIMLPILCVMDAIGVWAYRRKWDGTTMSIILPAAIVGIGIGTLVVGIVDEAALRLANGVLAIGFTIYAVAGKHLVAEPRPQSRWRGSFWSALSGLTSFISHAGGPPLSVYMLPLKMDKTLFVGTTVIYYAVVNYVKLVPYAFLGQFTLDNLRAAAMLLPLAPIGMALGFWAHRHVSQLWFYRLCYLFLALTGLKLVYDGIVGLAA